jgi:hypothetical protein
MQKGWKTTEIRIECCMADQEEERRTEGPRFRWLDDVEDLREREREESGDGGL